MASISFCAIIGMHNTPIKLDIINFFITINRESKIVNLKLNYLPLPRDGGGVGVPPDPPEFPPLGAGV